MKISTHGNCEFILDIEISTCIFVVLYSLLASGSDDVQVIIWDPFRHKSVTSIRTGHQGNIFSAKVSCCVQAVSFMQAQLSYFRRVRDLEFLT